MSRLGSPQSDPPGSLNRLRLFQKLEQAEREEIVAAANTVRHPRGQVLFRQGSGAKSFYVLRQGRVKLTQLTADGELVLVRLVMPGEAFGGVAALGERTYPVSAEASEDSVALSWSGRTMDRLLRKHPQLALNFIELLAERLHDMQARYEELATEQVEQRLARTLLRLLKRAGREVEGGTLVDVRLSRQELAEMTGTSLFTVSRILNRWQEAGVIQSHRQRIVVLDRQALADIAETSPTSLPDDA